MRIMCCCSQLRSKATPAANEQPPPNLPASPPAARLPPLGATDLALSLPSTPDRSSLTDPLPGAADDALVQPSVLVIEELDDGEGGEQAADDSSKSKPLSALEAVKARIRRHFFQDTLPRQGETREQMAHRAEVKRLMRKRIRDELQTESEEPAAEPSTPPRIASPIAAPLGNGPRDTIEFMVEGNAEKATGTKALCHSLGYADGDDHGSQRFVVHRTLSPHSMQKDERRAMARPVSLQHLSNSAMTTFPVKHVHGRLRQRSSSPESPAPPVLRPALASGANDASSLASWRLSLETDRLLDFLSSEDGTRRLSQALLYASPSQSSCNIDAALAKHKLSSHLRSHSLPSTLHNSTPMKGRNSSQVSLASSHRTQIPPSLSLIRAESPVGLWLRTQAQPFRFSNLSQLPSDQISESATAADMVVETDEVAISTGSPSSRTCRRIFLGHHDKHKLLDLSSRDDSQRRQESHCGANDSMQPTLRSSSPCSVLTTASLKHKTKPVMHGIVRKGLTGLKATFSRGNAPFDPVEKNIKMTSIPAINLGPDISVSDFTRPDFQKLLVDSESDTSSFHRREIELRAVEERFRNSHLRQTARLPVESRFYEVFQEQAEAGARELLSPLISTIPQPFVDMEMYHLDGNGPEVSEDQAKARYKTCRSHLEVPAIHHSTNKLRAIDASSSHFDKSGSPHRRRGFSSSKDGDETAEMWKRALEADSAARSRRRSLSHHKPASHAEMQRSRPDSRDPSPTSKVTVTQVDEDIVFRRSLEKSNKILEDWARQLSNPGPALRQGSSPLSSPCHPRNMTSRTPPASWSVFPSVSREARNALAGESDLVVSRDFAIVGLSPSGQTLWVTDREDAESKLKMNTRSVSGRYARPFQRFRLSRLWAGRPRTPSKDNSTRGARRSSIRTSGDLEYPELEILPNVGGYEELRVIKKGLNEMRGLSTSTQSITSPQAVGLTRARMKKTPTPSLNQPNGSPGPEMSKTPGAFACRGLDASAIISSSRGDIAPEVDAGDVMDPGVIACSSSSSPAFHLIKSSSSSLRSLKNESILRHKPARAIPNVAVNGAVLRYDLIPSSHTTSNIQGPRTSSQADGLRFRPFSSHSSPN